MVFRPEHNYSDTSVFVLLCVQNCSLFLLSIACWVIRVVCRKDSPKVFSVNLFCCLIALSFSPKYSVFSLVASIDNGRSSGMSTCSSAFFGISHLNAEIAIDFSHLALLALCHELQNAWMLD